MKPKLIPEDLADAALSIILDGTIDHLLDERQDSEGWTPDFCVEWESAHGELAVTLAERLLPLVKAEAEKLIAEERERRINAVVDRQAKVHEAKGLAIELVNDYRRSQRTPEENRAKAEQDLEAIANRLADQLAAKKG